MIIRCLRGFDGGHLPWIHRRSVLSPIPAFPSDLPPISPIYFVPCLSSCFLLLESSCSDFVLPLYSPSSTQTPCSPCFLRMPAPTWTPDLLYPDPPCCLNLLHLNPEYPSIQINLIILFNSSLCIYSSYCPYLQLLSNLCLTSVWHLSDSGLWPLIRNYRTYLHIIQVGTTHKLKPSPTCYPLPIIC